MSGHCLLKICKDKRHELSSLAANGVEVALYTREENDDVRWAQRGELSSYSVQMLKSE